MQTNFTSCSTLIKRFSGILTLILVFLLLMEPNIGTYNPPTDGNETVGILLQTAIPLKGKSSNIFRNLRLLNDLNL